MGLSYETLSTLEIPCGRGYFYERYRNFFWCLDRVREKIVSYSEKRMSQVFQHLRNTVNGP